MRSIESVKLAVDHVPDTVKVVTDPSADYAIGLHASSLAPDGAVRPALLTALLETRHIRAPLQVQDVKFLKRFGIFSSDVSLHDDRALETVRSAMPCPPKSWSGST